MNGPSGDWPDEISDLGPSEVAPASASREDFTLEVLTVAGDRQAVEFRLGPDIVEVWAKQRCLAVLARPVLRSWLARPRSPLVVDSIAFSLERMVAASGLAAPILPGIQVWTLPAPALADLRQRI